MYKNVKVTAEEPQEDGSKKITDESYYEDLTYRRITFEKPIFTSNATILRDTMSCLNHLKEGSPEIIIHIKTKHGEPYQIIKRWVDHKEEYGRR